MGIENSKVNQNSKKKSKQRTAVLPIACYETTLDRHIHSFTPLHWHDEVEFILIIKGEATFQINEKEIVVKEGNGLFINSGCIHQVKKKGKIDCFYMCLNISPHFLLTQELYKSYVYPYIQSTNLSYLYIGVKENWEKNIVAAITKINQLIQEKPPYFEIEVTIQLRVIWRNLITNNFYLEYNQKETIKVARMKRMLNWVHLHFAEKITLEDIASAGQLSQSECCRYFKRILNTTPLNYVIDYRVQKSLTLLQQAKCNVNEIACQVGFNSTSYFIYKFRKLMKMTPLSYKNLNREISN